MYKLLHPSIRARSAPPVSVRVRTRVNISFSLRIGPTVLQVRIFEIADLNLSLRDGDVLVDSFVECIVLRQLLSHFVTL